MSDRADFEIVADGAWHWYEATVTIADDAYAFGKSIVPYFGWLTDNTVAGTLRVNGVTVYKVGNQWCTMFCLGSFITRYSGDVFYTAIWSRNRNG